MNKELFISELKKINIDIKEDQLIKLDEYYNLLINENKKINLTGITEYEEVYLKHFFDSLTINRIIKLDNQSLIDVGTGAGFPGLILKIIFPNLKVTLLDSLTKRCNFLNLVIEKLKLENIEVINERAEIYSKNIKEKYDIITTRAVANLKELLEITTPLLKINGNFIAMKSNVNEEIKNIDNCLKELSIKIADIKEFKLPIENSKRTLISFEKLKKTNSKYPREYSKIKRSPL